MRGIGLFAFFAAYARGFQNSLRRAFGAKCGGSFKGTKFLEIPFDLCQDAKNRCLPVWEAAVFASFVYHGQHLYFRMTSRETLSMMVTKETRVSFALSIR